MKTEIIMIVDRSGSMSVIRTDAEGGINNFIEEQKKVPGEARLTLVQFDDKIETLMQGEPLDKVPPYRLHPRGGTALYDAIGRTLNEQGERITYGKWAELVICVIATDGQENMSRGYTAARVKQMTEHAEKHGWKFIFLAANQDAFATGAATGMNMHTTSNFQANSIGTQSAYAAASASTMSLRTTGHTVDLQTLVDEQMLKRQGTVTP